MRKYHHRNEHDNRQLNGVHLLQDNNHMRQSKSLYILSVVVSIKDTTATHIPVEHAEIKAYFPETWKNGKKALYTLFMHAENRSLIQMRSAITEEKALFMHAQW